MQERSLGILGKKLGMTQIFNEKGEALGATVLELGPCLVLGKRSKANNSRGHMDGYAALQLGFGPKEARKVNKAEAGALKAVGGAENARRYVRELRVSEETLAKFEVGQEITLKDLGIKPGDRIDITGTTRGKGFQGVVKRHGFQGFPATHGTHEYFRHGGSIGNRKFPGRVFKGRRMAGHQGDVRVTVQSVRVAQVRDQDNVLIVHGAVPGSKNGYVVIRPAVKAR